MKDNRLFDNGICILDGAMGTMLQEAGMPSDADQNDYLLDNPEVIEKIHQSYVDAGSDVIYTPTFNINRRRMEERGDRISEDIRRLVEPALKVKKRCAETKKTCADGPEPSAGRNITVALDVGPLGEMIEPLGALRFEEAYACFAKLVSAGAAAGADLIVIETMTDIYEVRAAVLAAKENTDLPVMVSMSFDEGGRTFTGTGLEVMATVLNGLGVDAMGINCSLGPDQILPLAVELKKYSRVPVFAKPNAGLPDPATGEYDIGAGDFAATIGRYLEAGIDIVGGCCGTSPEYIRCIRALVDDMSAETIDSEITDPSKTGDDPEEPSHGEKPEDGGASSRPPLKLCGRISNRPPLKLCGEISNRPLLKLCGRSRIVEVDHITIVGERLNPTGKKRMKQALLDGDHDYVLSQAIEQADAGAEILDVNVGVPGIDEVKVLPEIIKSIQSVVDLPIQIDSSNADAVEAALRVCVGKPIVNSVNGDGAVMDKILPLVSKYGAAVIALTLDEGGIPETAEERLDIAGRIFAKATKLGIPAEDIIVDCLTLTASAQQKEVQETLRALKMVKERLGLRTTLGVSNVSFGLPLRPLINRTFLVMAMENGLDLPIINPNDREMMASIDAYNVLKNVDITAEKYIERYSDSGASGGGGTSRGAGTREASGGGGTSRGVGTREAPGGGGKTREEASGSGSATRETGTGEAGRRLLYAVEKGLGGEAESAVRKLLEEKSEMEVVNDHLIPALDKVGKAFEKGTLFLPQMLQAATAAQQGFEIIKDSLAVSGKSGTNLGEVVIATVKGDIHDIGKNIVKTIMENYGYKMIDLGKNVSPDEIVRVVTERDIKLVGLSALMTTTLKSMEETIAAVKKAAPDCRVMVGGAVLTEDYAVAIGADYYCNDAMRSVEAAREVFGN